MSEAPACGFRGMANSGCGSSHCISWIRSTPRWAGVDWVGGLPGRLVRSCCLKLWPHSLRAHGFRSSRSGLFARYSTGKGMCLPAVFAVCAAVRCSLTDDIWSKQGLPDATTIFQE